MVPSITCAETSVNISCYGLHADYIAINMMANYVIMKYEPNHASIQPGGFELSAHSLITRLWTTTVHQSINTPNLEKRKK